MHLVGAVRLAAPAGVVEGLGHEIVLGEAAGAVHLHAAIEDALYHLRHADLGCGDHVAGLLGAHLVHFLAGFQHQQAGHFQFGEAVGDILAHRLVLGQGAAKGGALGHALAGLFDGPLPGPQQAHAVVHAARPEPPLGDLEAAALAQQHVFQRHAHVFKQQLGVAEGRVIVAQGGQRPHHRQARGTGGDQHLGLLLVAIGVVRVGLAHDDEDPGALVHGAGNKPLATVEHPLIALAGNAQLDVGGVTGGHLGLCHGVGRAYFTCQQGLEPLFLLGGGGVLHEDFHVAGVRGVAVEHLGAPLHPAHHFRQWRVVEIAEAVVIAKLCQLGGHEQVPQALAPGFFLELVHQRQGREPVGRAVQLPGVGGLVGVDMLVHEGLEPGLVGHGFIAELEQDWTPCSVLLPVLAAATSSAARGGMA